jgi:hypothetical protein
VNARLLELNPNQSVIKEEDVLKSKLPSYKDSELPGRLEG